jgi:hypothetical protein
MNPLQPFSLVALAWVALGGWNVATLQGEETAAAAKVQAPGLGNPGTLSALEIDAGAGSATAFALRGGDARQQLIVSGKFSSGQYRDFTRKVKYTSDPAGIVQIDETGLVTPLADGETTVIATTDAGQAGKIAVKVEGLKNQIPINFPNQIVPIFTKLGCNSGGCHGKASGQNGFKLSLLGFEPTEDFEYLVKEGRGRRLFPAAPEKSLLLMKAINAMPHGGGHRLDADSHEYRLMRRWIAQGMPYGKPDDPTVARIEVVPPARAMERGGEQQIAVIAHYTDGSTEDVTRTAQFDPNDPEMAEATVTGLVKTLDLTGDVAIMARYQSQVAVFRASIPLGVKVDNLPKSDNLVDKAVFGKLAALGVPPSPVCDDSTFLRRSAIDICGRMPTPEETQKFLADTDPNKRAKWIDTLLASTAYADFFANKWNAILRNKSGAQNSIRGNYSFHAWIRDSFYDNKPYDQFVRDVLAASGELGQNPPVVWYKQVKANNEQVEDCAQLFLGLRIQCARCHHHPFEKWSQRDYYGLSAFFSQVGRKPGLQPNEERIYHKRGLAKAQNPKTGENLSPTGLGAPPLELTPDEDPRHALVDWMSSPDNPFFAKALVNRYWKHFFSRGIVDPEDDMRVTNPASNPELLDGLSQHFITSGFDMKDLIRTICNSQVYQLSSEPNDYNRNDKQNFSRYYPKRLNAEVLLDSINLVTNSSTGFSNLPSGTRAVQLPTGDGNSYFLTVFGKPQMESACECERSSEANLAQSLHLLNSSEVQGKLSNGSGRAAVLANDKDRPEDAKIAELYLWVYSRQPTPDETKVALAHIEKHKDNKKVAYEDILWALINTKEFLFNH